MVILINSFKVGLANLDILYTLYFYKEDYKVLCLLKIEKRRGFSPNYKKLTVAIKILLLIGFSYFTTLYYTLNNGY